MRLWRISLVSSIHTQQKEVLPRLESKDLTHVCTAFALAAALAQIVAPTDAQVVNLLGFHVIAKLMVHYPAYLSNIALPRTFAHISATAALLNVCWRLAAGN